MLSLVQNTDIDFSKWDYLNSLSLDSSILFSSWYLNSITNRNWDALVYGDYTFAIPLPYVKFKHGKKYCVPKQLPYLDILSTKVEYRILNDNLLSKLLNLKIENLVLSRYIKLSNMQTLYDQKYYFKELYGNYEVNSKHYTNRILNSLKIKDKKQLYFNNNLKGQGFIRFLLENERKVKDSDIIILQNLIMQNTKNNIKIYGLYNKRSKLIAAALIVYSKIEILPLKIIIKDKTDISPLDLFYIMYNEFTQNIQGFKIIKFYRNFTNFPEYYFSDYFNSAILKRIELKDQTHTKTKFKLHFLIRNKNKN